MMGLQGLISETFLLYPILPHFLFTNTFTKKKPGTPAKTVNGTKPQVRALQNSKHLQKYPCKNAKKPWKTPFLVTKW